MKLPEPQTFFFWLILVANSHKVAFAWICIFTWAQSRIGRWKLEFNVLIVSMEKKNPCVTWQCDESPKCKEIAYVWWKTAPLQQKRWGMFSYMTKYYHSLFVCYHKLKFYKHFKSLFEITNVERFLFSKERNFGVLKTLSRCHNIVWSTESNDFSSILINALDPKFVFAVNQHDIADDPYRYTIGTSTHISSQWHKHTS